MNLLKRTISAAVSVVFALSMAVSWSLSTMALDEPLDIHLTIETREIDLADIPGNRVVSLEVYIENCPPVTGMWVYFEKDPRIEFKETAPFSIAEGVDGVSPLNTVSYQELEPDKLGCGIPADYGTFLVHSGAIITVNVVIPEDAKNGDFYPVNFTKNISGASMSVDLGYELSDRYDESSFTMLNNGGVLITESTTSDPPQPEPPAPDEPGADAPGNGGGENTAAPDADHTPADDGGENHEPTVTSAAVTSAQNKKTSTTVTSTKVVTTIPATSSAKTTSASSSAAVSKTTASTTSEKKDTDGNDKEDTGKKGNNWTAVILITCGVTAVSSAAVVFTRSKRKK